MPPPNPVILVTGTSRGLGLSIARFLLTTHLPISLVTISRSPSPSGTIALPSGTVHSHTHLQLDVSTPGAPAMAVAGAVKTYGRLDGIVVNHGVLDPVERIAGEEVGAETEKAASADVEMEGGKGRWVDGLNEWRMAWEVNFFSVVGLCRAAIPHLRATSGRIVIISSGASQTGYSGWGCYSATKAALNSLCRTLAVEEPLITSICLRPGVLDTDMQRDVREKHEKAMGKSQEKFLELHRSGRLLRPEVPGAVVANLVIKGQRDLSGGFFSWDSPELRDYQDTTVPEL
ncbi:hypothetical protein EV426DRAFT_371772 [Tirmania nivea]|nr:hypothetical protein EV426DRAFT_371772 [Tirmania nivea]